MKYPNLKTCKVSVIGLGYVGLPLAVELAAYSMRLPQLAPLPP